MVNMGRAVAGARATQISLGAPRITPELYAQFCMGVETSDVPTVKRLVTAGVDPRVPYSVDNVITTPLRSAIKRGDAPVLLTLLESRHPIRLHPADFHDSRGFTASSVNLAFVQHLSAAIDPSERPNVVIPVSGPAPPTKGVRKARTFILNRKLQDLIDMFRGKKTSPKDNPAEEEPSQEDSHSESEASSEDKDVASSDGESPNRTSPPEDDAGDSSREEEPEPLRGDNAPGVRKRCPPPGMLSENPEGCGSAATDARRKAIRTVARSLPPGSESEMSSAGHKPDDYPGPSTDSEPEPA